MPEILTALSPQIMRCAPVGGDYDHTTREYRCFHLGQLCSLPATQICLWDSWGLDETNYTADFLLRILHGELPNEWEMHNVCIDGTNLPTSSLDETSIRRVHAVLLFVPIGILEDQVLLGRVKESLRLTNKMNLNALIIVTHADTLEAKNRSTHQQKIAGEFNLPSHRINLVENYTKDAEKSFEIDKNTLRILAEITAIGDQYIKTFLQPSPTMRGVQAALNNYFPYPQNPPPPKIASLPPLSVVPQMISPLAQKQSQSSSQAIPSPDSQSSRSDSGNLQPECVKVHFQGKMVKISLNESTSFSSVLLTVCRRFSLDQTQYFLADDPEDGLMYGLNDMVWKGLKGKGDVYLEKY